MPWKYLFLWNFLDYDAPVRYHRGAMHNYLDPDTSPETFMACLRSLMLRENITIRDLSHALKLSIGTVGNWFYGNKSMPKKHRVRIAELIESHEGVRLQRREAMLLSVCCANAPDTTLWCSAAGVPEYDFTKTRVYARFADLCSRWCTEVIMREAGSVLNRLAEKDLQAFAAYLLAQDRAREFAVAETKAQFRKTFIMEADSDMIYTSAGRLYIPVFIEGYRHFLVRMATEVVARETGHRTSVSQFIISCLNNAAMQALQNDLLHFCGQAK